MPTCCYYNPISANPRKWEQCRQVVANEMIADGWVKGAKKFSAVQEKKAMKLFFSK